MGIKQLNYLSIFSFSLCALFLSDIIAAEENIIKEDYFECVKSSKNFKLLPNENKKYAFIASDSTDVSIINIDEKRIPQKMINFTDVSYLSVNPEENKPVCFYIYYSRKDKLELIFEKKYSFYVIGDEKEEIVLEFELDNLLKNKELHIDISTKKGNTIFKYIEIYRKENDYDYITYKDENHITVTPLSKSIKIKILSYLKDSTNYDEFTFYAYITGREKYKSLVITGIVFFYLSIVCLFCDLLFYCDKSYKAKENEEHSKEWKFRLDSMGKRCKDTYCWPCLKDEYYYI